MVAVMIVFDPVARDAFEDAPYGLLLVSHVQNAVVPLTITFILLRYTDLRRRTAEARVDELLTNAIPAAIATRLKRGSDGSRRRILRRPSCSRTSWASRPGRLARPGPRRGAPRPAVHAFR